MNSESEFTWDEANKAADAAVFENTGSHLTDQEKMVLDYSWKDYSYEKMAEKCKYNANYLRGDVGNKLWKKLSEALGEKVSKTNFKEALKREWQKQRTASNPAATGLEFPEGSVRLDSPFYVERNSIESKCYERILQPGALIRIKASNRMGKTSLLDRILDRAEKEGYKTARLNLQQADEAKFSNLDIFLRWFSAYISLQLDVPAQLDNYWNEPIIGSLLSCKTYFQAHLLQQIDSPLVLALDEVDRVFQYSHIFKDFFPMLRNWHEEANTKDIWKKLRLVVVHSTEDYGRLDINQSPFNVGLPVELTEFTLLEVQDLAQRHKLDRTLHPVKLLMAMVEGHPYLVRLALYHLAGQEMTLEKLLQDAPTDAGVYKNHLRRHLETLQQHPNLAAALKQVVTTTEPVRLDTMLGYKLQSMGLIQLLRDDSSPRCELYRLYFRDRLGNES